MSWAWQPAQWKDFARNPGAKRKDSVKNPGTAGCAWSAHAPDLTVSARWRNVELFRPWFCIWNNCDPEWSVPGWVRNWKTKLCRDFKTTFNLQGWVSDLILDFVSYRIRKNLSRSVRLFYISLSDSVCTLLRPVLGASLAHGDLQPPGQPNMD